MVSAFGEIPVPIRSLPVRRGVCKHTAGGVPRKSDLRFLRSSNLHQAAVIKMETGMITTKTRDFEEGWGRAIQTD